MRNPTTEASGSARRPSGLRGWLLIGFLACGGADSTGPSSLPRPVPNQAPIVTIVTPVNGANFADFETVRFEGAAVDPEDGALPPASLRWFSNREGLIGAGASFELAGLPLGAHDISLLARDSEDKAGAALSRITIWVPLIAELADAAHDETPDPRITTPQPDLVSGSVLVVGSELRLSLRVRPGTLHEATSRLSIMIDTDRDRSTGFQGNPAARGVDAHFVGSDYYISLGAAIRGPVELGRHRGLLAWDRWAPEGVTLVVIEDGLEAVVPLSVLGNDDGVMDVRAYSQARFEGTNGYTAVVDEMPESHHPWVTVK